MLKIVWNVFLLLQYLPLDFSSSNALKRKCCKIILTDGRERSWAMNLSFNKSTNTFYISRGWRHFCDENGKKEGSYFTFNLMKNGETPLLSFCSSESVNDKTQEDKSNSQRCRDSASQNQNRFVTLTLTNDSLKSSRLVSSSNNNSCWFYCTTKD